MPVTSIPARSSAMYVKNGSSRQSSCWTTICAGVRRLARSAANRLVPPSRRAREPRRPARRAEVELLGAVAQSGPRALLEPLGIDVDVARGVADRRRQLHQLGADGHLELREPAAEALQPDPRALRGRLRQQQRDVPARDADEVEAAAVGRGQRDDAAQHGVAGARSQARLERGQLVQRHERDGERLAAAAPALVLDGEQPAELGLGQRAGRRLARQRGARARGAVELGQQARAQLGAVVLGAGHLQHVVGAAPERFEQRGPVAGGDQREHRAALALGRAQPVEQREHVVAGLAGGEQRDVDRRAVERQVRRGGVGGVHDAGVAAERAAARRRAPPARWDGRRARSGAPGSARTARLRRCSGRRHAQISPSPAISAGGRED